MGSAEINISRVQNRVVRRSETKAFHLSQLRKIRGREQAAAICYRISERGIEFLLVQTRNGCWTFPKGKVEPGLTPAQSAALEAFEEAGVHGRIEEISFIQYNRRTRTANKADGSMAICVSAHLCEVLRQVTPQESGRNPTWCTPEKSKRRLQMDRNVEVGTVMTGVIDHAVARIQVLHQSRRVQELARIPFISIATLKRR